MCGLPVVGKGITEYMGSPPLIESAGERVEGVCGKGVRSGGGLVGGGFSPFPSPLL